MTRDGTEWRPDPARQLSILFDVFALGQQTRTLVQAAMRGAGLRPDEYAAYSVVFEADGVTMTEVARQLGMPVTTAADYVRSMQARGHVRRQAHPTDNRAYQLRLTAAGLRAHRKASAAFDGAYQALRQELGALDEASTRAMLQQLTASAQRALDRLAPSVDHEVGRAPTR
jgi:DNA-binding MarR family transcriptional regulator